MACWIFFFWGSFESLNKIVKMIFWSHVGHIFSLPDTTLNGCEWSIMYPLKNWKWWFFGSNMKISNVYILYNNNFQIPSVGKGGKRRRLFAKFLDFFKKNLYFSYYIRVFFWKCPESCQTSFFPFPPAPRREFGNFSCLV